jgi:ankyrin repeat protein
MSSMSGASDGAAGTPLEAQGPTVSRASSSATSERSIRAESGKPQRNLAVEGTEQAAVTTENSIDTVHKACAYGDYDALRALVRAETRHLTNKQEYHEGVKALLESRDPEGYTCLQWAALNNRVSIVVYLLDQGVDPNLQDTVSEQTALHWAAVRGSLECMSALLSSDVCDSKKVDSKGYSMCHVAAQYGQTEMLYHAFMKYNMELDAPDVDGRTPLHWAAYKGHRDSVKLLIMTGADVMRVDKEECSPLHWAAIKGNTESCMALLQGGAEDALESTESSGMTPSQLAIEKGHRGLGLSLAEYRSHMLAKEKRTKGSGLVSLMMRLHLAPIIWGIIISMVALMTFSVVLPSRSGDNVLFGNNTVGIAVGAWLTYVLAGLGLVFLYKTTVADPGFLPRNNIGGRMNGKVSRNRSIEDGGAADMSSLNSPALWGSNWNQMCVSCRIVRPLRAKHCATTDRCVECFDHFCPWVGNAVGKGNRHFFLIFLWLELGAIVASGVTVVVSLHHAIKISNEQGISSWSIVGPVLFVVFDLILVVSVAALAIAQASQVSRNVTTNELSNWGRYKYLHSTDERGEFTNPFDRGMRKNCREVCFPAKAPKAAYTIDSIRATKPSNNIHGGDTERLVSVIQEDDELYDKKV